MDGLDRRPEIDRPVEAAAVSEDTSRDSETNVVVEKRTRGEAHTDLRQAAESGWDRSFKFDPPREELALFRPEKAGLNSVSIGDAVRYIEQNRDVRPWLQAVERSCPETRWVFAAADLSGAHWPVRHEGWVSEEKSMRRVAYLEDPAQLDPDKRQAGIDGLLPRDRYHVCADRSTRITDPDACATALVRGTRHPAVQAALAMPFDRKYRQQPVWLPIADLLGKDGHKVCTGWQLQPEGGSTNEAMENRRAWRTALAEGRPPNGPEPRALPVPTFEGGTIAFIISQNRQRTGYKIASLATRPCPAARPRRAAGAKEKLMSQPYWIRYPDGPFTTLIAVATAYLHPETDPDGLEALQERAADDDVEMRIFKDELRQANRDPGLLPGNELFRHVAYEDGSDEKFLRRLWRDLYGDEPVIPSDQP